MTEKYLNEQVREFMIREAQRLSGQADTIAAEHNETISQLESVIAKATEMRSDLLVRIENWTKEARNLREIAATLTAARDRGEPFVGSLTIVS